MAGQNLVALGLDVSSFNENKKKILQEFITIFDELSKYHELKLNPVLGEGLATFNKSLSETNKLLTDLNGKINTVNTTNNTASNSFTDLSKQITLLTSKITQQEKELTALKLKLSETTKEILKNDNALKGSIKTKKDEEKATENLIQDHETLRRTLRAQANEYSRIAQLKGKDSPQAKSALADYSRTAHVIGDIDKKLESAQPKAFGLGKGLSTAYNQLRIIAYILPGFGIAGLFNLAIDAIEKAAEAMGIFTNETEKALKYDKAYNDILSEQIGLFEELVKVSKDYSESFSSASLRRLVDAKGILTAQGASGDLTNPSQADINSRALLDASRELVFNRLEGRQSKQRGENSIPTQKEIDEALARQKDYQNKQIAIIEQAKQKVVSIRTQLETSDNKSLFGFGTGDTDKLKAELDKVNSQIDLSKSGLSESNRITQSYFDTKKKLEEDSLAYAKYIADEERKLRTETAKANIATEINRNDVILKSELVFEKGKIDSLKRILALNKRINSVEEDNVLSNNSSSSVDKQLATTKRINANKQLEIKFGEDIFKIRQEFYQRLIKAQTSINKDEIDKSAIANEKIYKNDERSLDERLKSYSDYINGKKQLQQLEYYRDIQSGAEKAGGLTNLTKEERNSIESSNIKNQASIQADAERQVFEIVSSSLKKQLVEIIRINSDIENEDIKRYTSELALLNDNLKNKIIRYKQYKLERDKIDKQFKISGLDEDIKNDEFAVGRLELQGKLLKNRKDVSDKAVSSSTSELEISKGLGDPELEVLKLKKVNDEKIGENNALNEAIKENDKETQKAYDKLLDDKLKKEKATGDEIYDNQKENARKSQELFNAIEKSFDAVYDTITSLEDTKYENQLARIKAIGELQLEQYEKEEDAISRSTLAEKEKSALLIQLAQQKFETEKRLAKEEKEIRKKQAKFDRDASIVQIQVKTALSIITAFSEGDPYTKGVRAIAAGVAGAAALIKALSTKIPEYKHGTRGIPHKGGLARTGEGGNPEVIKEPYRSPYLVNKDNVSFLPEGTHVFPIKDTPVFDIEKGNNSDNGWEQTLWLGNQINKSSKRKIVNNNTVILNLNFELYKARKLKGA